MRIRSLCVLFFFVVTFRDAYPANIADFIDYSLRNSANQVVLPGRLFIPSQAINNPNSPCPLIVFLHGGGASGTNNITQVEHTPDLMLDEAKRRGAFLYVPQTATNWSSATTIDSVMAMIDLAIAEQNVNASRLFATGFSNGGGGTWNLLSRYSGRFAAAVGVSGVMPIAGFDAANLLSTRIFAVHARDDATVPVGRSRYVVSAVLDAAGEPLPTYPSFGNSTYFLVSNPHFEFHRELAAAAPPGALTNHLIGRTDLDLIYFEQPAGGHAGMAGVFYWPPLYDWIFAQRSTVPEPGTLFAAICSFMVAVTKRTRRAGAESSQLAQM